MIKKELTNSRQAKDALNHGTFVTVPRWLATIANLSPTELLIYMTIKEATDKAALQLYTGSVKGLCALWNVSIPTARKALETLEARGFIRKGFIRRNGKSMVAYEAYEIGTRADIKEGKLFEILNRNKVRTEQFRQNGSNFRRNI